MALIGNGYRHNMIGKLFGAQAIDGANPSVHLYMGHKSGTCRNMFAGEGITSDKASVPDGVRHPVAWIMARRNGGMSSRNVTVMTITGNAAGAMGVNGEGDSTLTFDATATAELIASAIGSATFAVTASGSVQAVLNGIGSASFTLTTSGTMGALAWGIGAAGMTVSATMTSYARGFMQGSTVDASVLTAEQIADAVWAKTLP